MTMIEQQEFLDTLTNPVRTRIKKNIGRFFKIIQSPDVISTTSLDKEGRYNLYVTARNKHVYNIVECYLELIFPDSDDYKVHKAFGGPNLTLGNSIEYLMMYYVVEASCND